MSLLAGVIRMVRCSPSEVGRSCVRFGVRSFGSEFWVRVRGVYTLRTLYFFGRTDCVPLLCWDYLLLVPFDPSHCSQVDSIGIDQVSQCLTGSTLCHGIGGVTVPVDPYYLSDLVPLVRLA